MADSLALGQRVIRRSVDNVVVHLLLRHGALGRLGDIGLLGLLVLLAKILLDRSGALVLAAEVGVALFVGLERRLGLGIDDFAHVPVDGALLDYLFGDLTENCVLVELWGFLDLLQARELAFHALLGEG